MTMEQIKSSNKDILTPADVSEVLGINSQTLRDCAKANPTLLGFPVVVMGTRVRIPRIAFIRFMEGIKNEETNQIST